jgi:hypothetical protein
VRAVVTQTEDRATKTTKEGGDVIGSDEIVRVEESQIRRFVALGLGRYEAIRAVDAGIDWQRVDRLVNENGCPLGVALELAR